MFQMAQNALPARVLTDFIEQWHVFARTRDRDLLDRLVADNAVMKSPAFYTPKESKPYLMAIADAALDVLKDFSYGAEWTHHDSVILEFEATVDGRKVKGIDRFRLNEAGRIMELEVLIRPLNGLSAVASEMRERLSSYDF